MKKIIMAIVVYFCLVSTLFSNPGQIHYTIPYQANVYEKASEDSKVLFVVAMGRKFVEYGRENGFVYGGIAHANGGMDGWIKLSDLSTTDSDGLTW